VSQKGGAKVPLVVTVIIIVVILITGLLFLLKNNKLPFLVNKEQKLVDCEKHLESISKGCAVFASHNNGHYPVKLEEIVQKGYMRKIPLCDSCNKPYIYFSQESPDFFIIKCPEKNIHKDTGLVDDGLYPVYTSREGLVRKGNYTESLETIVTPTSVVAYESPVPENTSSVPEPTEISVKPTEERIKTQKPSKHINPEASIHNNKGLTYQEQENYEMALKEFDLALQIEPDYAEALKNKGNVYYYMGKTDKALEYYNMAIAKDPSYWNGYNNIGNVYFEQNDLENAERYYGKAAELCKNDVKPYNNLGDVLIERGKYQEAIDNYNKALELGLKNSELYSQLGHSYWKISYEYIKSKETETAWQYANKALENLGKATELNQKDSIPFFRAGIIYFNFGPEQYDKAMKCMNDALEREPDNYTYLYARGQIYDAKRDIKNAKSDYEKALKLAQESNDQEMANKVKQAFDNLKSN